MESVWSFVVNKELLWHSTKNLHFHYSGKLFSTCCFVNWGTKKNLGEEKSREGKTIWHSRSNEKCNSYVVILLELNSLWTLLSKMAFWYRKENPIQFCVFQYLYSCWIWIDSKHYACIKGYIHNVIMDVTCMSFKHNPEMYLTNFVLKDLCVFV